MERALLYTFLNWTLNENKFISIVFVFMKEKSMNTQKGKGENKNFKNEWKMYFLNNF